MTSMPPGTLAPNWPFPPGASTHTLSPGEARVQVQSVSQLTQDQVNDLVALYQSEWWTKGRRTEDVRRMLDHSDLLFGCCEPGTEQLVAFARVLTDRVYKAIIFDVIVAESFRGTGLGRHLMQTIVGHPELRRVQHLELYCLPELIPFYRQFGFTDDLGTLTFMRRPG